MKNYHFKKTNRNYEKYASCKIFCDDGIQTTAISIGEINQNGTNAYVTHVCSCAQFQLTWSSLHDLMINRQTGIHHIFMIIEMKYSTTKVIIFSFANLISRYIYLLLSIQVKSCDSTWKCKLCVFTQRVCVKTETN